MINRKSSYNVKTSPLCSSTPNDITGPIAEGDPHKVGREKMMDTRMDGVGETTTSRGATSRQVGRDEPTTLRANAITTRLGAVALPLGILVLVVSEIFHPSGEDPTDHYAVFMEYAHSDIWTTVHLAQYFGFLLMLGGLVALYYSISGGPGAGAGLAPFGLAAAITTAASYTVLQAVDGITLKHAVDAWVSAPAAAKTATFAAAEAVRWTEIGMNSLSNFLTGLTLFLYGLAIALGILYPRWVGWMAVVSGAAFMYNGAVEVAYECFVPSTTKLVGLLLLAVWAIAMAILMWRNGSARRIARLASATSTSSAQQPPNSR
jgi:hypothetical protein